MQFILLYLTLPDVIVRRCCLIWRCSSARLIRYTGTLSTNAVGCWKPTIHISWSINLHEKQQMIEILVIQQLVNKSIHQSVVSSIDMPLRAFTRPGISSSISVEVGTVRPMMEPFFVGLPTIELGESVMMDQQHSAVQCYGIVCLTSRPGHRHTADLGGHSLSFDK